MVIVDERPIIANVTSSGSRSSTTTLTKSLKDVGIGEGKPFDKAWPTAPNKSSSAST